MNKNIIKNLLVFILLAGALIAFQPVLAQVQTGLSNLKNVGDGTGLTVAGGGSLPKIIGGVVTAVLGALGLVFLVMIIWGGIRWGFLAQGAPEEIKKARSMIVNAVIGLLIVFASYAITTFVLSQLGNIK